MNFPLHRQRRGGRFGPATAALVPASENHAQGGYLNAFYMLRLTYKPQAFLVVPVPL